MIAPLASPRSSSPGRLAAVLLASAVAFGLGAGCGHGPGGKVPVDSPIYEYQPPPETEEEEPEEPEEPDDDGDDDGDDADEG